jgi:hypothetical protein
MSIRRIAFLPAGLLLLSLLWLVLAACGGTDTAMPSPTTVVSASPATTACPTCAPPPSCPSCPLCPTAVVCPGCTPCPQAPMIPAATATPTAALTTTQYLIGLRSASVPGHVLPGDDTRLLAARLFPIVEAPGQSVAPPEQWVSTGTAPGIVRAALAHMIPLPPLPSTVSITDTGPITWILFIPDDYTETVVAWQDIIVEPNLMTVVEQDISETVPFTASSVPQTSVENLVFARNQRDAEGDPSKMLWIDLVVFESIGADGQAHWTLYVIAPEEKNPAGGSIAKRVCCRWASCTKAPPALKPLCRLRCRGVTCP